MENIKKQAKQTKQKNRLVIRTMESAEIDLVLRFRCVAIIFISAS